MTCYWMSCGYVGERRRKLQAHPTLILRTRLFYLDKENKTSEFIGIGVAPEYRDLNIGSFLIASWIDLCLNNGYDFLGANKKQRKPFLLYLLKTYGFEIFDKSINDIFSRTILTGFTTLFASLALLIWGFLVN